MKKTYIQPEIELLSVSALEDFLVASPSQDTVVESGTGDGWDKGDSDDYGKWA